MVEVRDEGGEVCRHFAVVLDGLEDLGTEGFGTAIPEEGGLPGEVEEGHGVAVPYEVMDAFGEGEGIGEGLVLMVAGGAGDGVVFGEGFAVEELFSKGNAFFQKGVVTREEGH